MMNQQIDLNDVELTKSCLLFGITFDKIDNGNVYFSVPETVRYGETVYSPEDSIKVAKGVVITHLVNRFGDSEENRWFINSHFHFFAKVRKDEVWSQENVSQILSSN